MTCTPTSPVHLVIAKGAAPNWWASTAIRLIDSGGNPTVSPTVGQPYWLEAQVQNTGIGTANSITLKFYACIGGTTPQPGQEIAIGSGQLTAGQTLWIRSSTQWTPATTNHTCLIASAEDPEDCSDHPGTLEPATQDFCAQRNITIMQMAKRMNASLATAPLGTFTPPYFTLPVFVGAGRRTKRVTLTATTDASPSADFLGQLGLSGAPSAQLVDLALGTSAEAAVAGNAPLALAIQPGTPSLAFVHVRATDADAAPGAVQVVHIVERDQDGVAIGGQTYVFVAPAASAA